jgi:transcriptional regulator with XRE-family HTH domain
MQVPKHLRRSKTGNIIGPRVKQARRKRIPPLSQDALSGRLAARGVTIGRAGIAKIESGHRAVSDYELVAFASALGVPLTWLLDGR